MPESIKSKVRINEPLGWPQGTVRAVITLFLTGAASIIAILSLFIEVEQSNPAVLFLFSTTTLAVGYYFGARTKETNDQDRSSSQIYPDSVIPGDTSDPEAPDLDKPPVPGVDPHAKQPEVLSDKADDQT